MSVGVLHCLDRMTDFMILRAGEETLVQQTVQRLVGSVKNLDQVEDKDLALTTEEGQTIYSYVRSFGSSYVSFGDTYGQMSANDSEYRALHGLIQLFLTELVKKFGAMDTILSVDWGKSILNTPWRFWFRSQTYDIFFQKYNVDVGHGMRDSAYAVRYTCRIRQQIAIPLPLVLQEAPGLKYNPWPAASSESPGKVINNTSPAASSESPGKVINNTSPAASSESPGKVINNNNPLLDLNILYTGDSSDYYKSQTINSIFGVNPYGRKDMKLHCQIHFILEDIKLTTIVFDNGRTWVSRITPKSLTRPVDWVKFFKYHRERPGKTNASIDSCATDTLELTLSVTGPYETYQGDDNTEIYIVNMEFRPIPPATRLVSGTTPYIRRR
jgi:hypothetical protein